MTVHILAGQRERCANAVPLPLNVSSDFQVVEHHLIEKQVPAPEVHTLIFSPAPAPPTVLALEFLVLTSSRNAEVCRARWSEIHLDGAGQRRFRHPHALVLCARRA